MSTPCNLGESNDAYDFGYKAGYAGHSWLDCPFMGREAQKWMRGYEAGKNAAAYRRASADRATTWIDNFPSLESVEDCGQGSAMFANRT